MVVCSQLFWSFIFVVDSVRSGMGAFVMADTHPVMLMCVCG